MITYKNKGLVILRSCYNCKHFNPMNGTENIGYCKISAMLFAFTMKRTVFPMVKTFYLCEEHGFDNEQFMMENYEKVSQEKSVKTKIDAQ